MKKLHVPREDEPGPYYGHPAVYIGPRGVPLGRSWAVYVADCGAHDRHTVKALVDTEEEAAEIVAAFIRASNGCLSAVALREGGTFSDLFTCFPVAFHHLFSGGNHRNRLKTKDIPANLSTLAGKEKYSVFLRGVITGGSLPYA